MKVESGRVRPLASGPRPSPVASRVTLFRWPFLVGLCALPLFSGCIVIPLGSLTASAALQEKQVQPAKSWLTSNKILMVDITGIITTEDVGFFETRKGTVEALKDALKKASEDPKIVAVVLRIDSPGGGVTASDLCYREVVKFKEEMAKKRKRSVPVVAVMMDTAASGGYYVAMAADEVWAHPTTVTGSIGVIATLPQLSGLTSKIGVDVRVIKSGKMKDIGSLWRDMKPEEKELLQNLIDSMYGQFVGVVAKGRKMDEKKVRELADGRVFTAAQAREAGLIDNVGYMDDALEAAKKRAQVTDASVVAYARGFEDKSNVYSQVGMAHPTSSQVNLINLDLGQWANPAATRFHYLWMP